MNHPLNCGVWWVGVVGFLGLWGCGGVSVASPAYEALMAQVRQPLLRSGEEKEKRAVGNKSKHLK